MQNLRSSDLSRLFRAALETMETNQQAVNELDGYNGNHGDNMVQNLQTITAALARRESASPSQALRYASRQLKAQGKGSTSAYYVKGLSQAAKRLEGRSELSRGDVMTLVQSLLGAVPSQGQSQQVDAGNSVFEQVVGLAANQQTPDGAGAPGSLLQALLQTQQPQSQASTPDSSLQAFLGGEEPSQGSQQPMGNLLGALLGGQPSADSGNAPDSPLSALLGSEQPQGGENPLGGMLGALLGGQPSQPRPQGESRPANLIQTLLPAAMAFLQAKQSGAETPEALVQALMGLLTNRRMNPLQAGTPRSAAGGLVAQSILQALDN